MSHREDPFDMNDHADFPYGSLPNVPEEFLQMVRQVDRTFVECHDKPFSDGEQAFCQLRNEFQDAFADSPFLHLQLLRAVESRLLTLALVKKQPIAKCLECLRRRGELEYGRGDIYGKAAQLVVFADYAVECGERDLARMLLEKEREQLNETATFCQSWMQTVTQRIDALTD
jgi:hypothetical protein